MEMTVLSRVIEQAARRTDNNTMINVNCTPPYRKAVIWLAKGSLPSASAGQNTDTVLSELTLIILEETDILI
ncbi:hypothetical protein J6590_013760 [Homalodisca vitripennis]|nr:hypothetical protein J6590_013760 [Homalodisca vitripennis]